MSSDRDDIAMDRRDLKMILAGPVKHLANKAEDVFTKKGCPVFYDGEVKPF